MSLTIACASAVSDSSTRGASSLRGTERGSFAGGVEQPQSSHGQEAAGATELGRQQAGAVADSLRQQQAGESAGIEQQPAVDACAGRQQQLASTTAGKKPVSAMANIATSEITGFRQRLSTIVFLKFTFPDGLHYTHVVAGRFNGNLDEISIPAVTM